MSEILGDNRMRIWPVAAVILAMLTAARRRPRRPAPPMRSSRRSTSASGPGAGASSPAADQEGSRLPDRFALVDAANQARRLAYWQAVRKDLAAIPEASLSAAEAVNYEVYADQLDTLINQQKFHEYEKPFNSDSSFWSGLGFTASRTFHTTQDYKNYIAQLNDIPHYFHDQTENMRAGLRRGFTPPRATLVGREVSVTVVADARGAEATNLWKPFKAMPAAVPPAEQEALRAQARIAIETKAQPAYRDLLKFLRDEYIPHTTETLAAESLPDGKAYYRAQIKEFTTLDMDPEAIHQLGLSEVAKIHAQMLEVMKETGFKGDFPAFLHFLRTDPQFYVKDPQELLNRAAWIAKRVDGKLPGYFGWLPRSRFGIEPVAPDIAPFYTSARGGTNTYLLNTYDLPSRPLYNLTALTMHESAPGMRCRAGWRRSRTACRSIGARSISRPTARAGRSIASGWASRWGCTTPPTTASAC